MTKEQKHKIFKALVEDRNNYARDCNRRIEQENGKITGADFMLQRFLDVLHNIDVKPQESEGQEYERAYQRGLDDAWEAARKSVYWWKDNEEGVKVFKELFDSLAVDNLFKFSASEAIAKIRKYEQEHAPRCNRNIYDENVIKKDIENPYQCKTVLYGLELVKPIIEADRAEREEA